MKDLFDVAGLPNTAGARMLQSASPASRDAEAIRRLEAAGAVLVATLNMDAFAYGFVTDNAFHGITRNPHDRTRFAGGSSGGSAAAVAAGMLPLALGSDTNGSIRVPAALCGVYGVKPEHGVLPLAGVYPFVDSFDDIGPFASSVADLKLAYEALLGRAVGDYEGDIRVARLGGWFGRNASEDVVFGLDRIVQHLGGVEWVELPETARARSAAYLMTAAEGGARHLAELRRRPMEFDPAVRDRLIAGALLPASAYLEAQRFRGWFRSQAEQIFERFDVLLAPSVGGPAPAIDQPVIEIDGDLVPARSHLGHFTQPLSFIGLPIIAAPLARSGLPLGVQLVGAPGREAVLFALAERLEAAGLVSGPERAFGPRRRKGVEAPQAASC